MAALDRKVPPPAVTLVAAAVMWVLANALPVIALPYWLRFGGTLILLVVGAAAGIAGAVEFRRSRTTLDPRRPEAASALVTAGIYTRTRNPMYLGLALFLLAWAVYLASLWSVLGVVAFILYLGRFQIQPEERALTVLFGQEYESYKSAVRRWI